MINYLCRSLERPLFVVPCGCLTASLFYIKRSFSFYIFGIRLLLNHSPSEWVFVRQKNPAHIAPDRILQLINDLNCSFLKKVQPLFAWFLIGDHIVEIAVIDKLDERRAVKFGVVYQKGDLARLFHQSSFELCLGFVGIKQPFSILIPLQLIKAISTL